MSKIDLKKSYLETTYSILIDEEKYDIKIGSPLPRIIQKLIQHEKTAIILTAWNPKSQAFPMIENISRNIELNSRIENYTFFKAVGQGIDLSWPAEESFFVIGVTKKEADKLAVYFSQNAYVWIEHEQQVSLIFTELW